MSSKSKGTNNHSQRTESHQRQQGFGSPRTMPKSKAQNRTRSVLRTRSFDGARSLR